MRVSNQPSGGTSASPAARTGGAPEVRQTRYGPGGAGAEPASDQIDLSSLAGRLAQTQSALAASRGQRVAHIAAAYRAGNYRTDAQQISRRMVDESLSAGGSSGQAGGR